MADSPSQSGQMVYSLVVATEMAMGLSHQPPPMLVDMSASMWIEKGQLNLRITKVKKHLRDPPYL